MILVRADGNSEIGMGHIMRCMSIAEQIKKQGAEVLFVTACKECIQTIENRGFKVELLNSDYKNMESELPALLNYTFDAILIDSYQMTNNYINKLKEVAKVICLDDIGSLLDADLLINYNIYAPELDYEYIKDSKTKCLLGSEYAPIRDEFIGGVAYELKEDAKNVMITTGGSDPLNISCALLNSFLRSTLLNKKGIVYHVVIGPMNQFANQLKKEFGNNPQVVLHENVTSMVDIMKECDVIVSAAGSTVYEACAVGIPMICFYFVENQRRIAEYFEKNTGVMNCGDFSFNDRIVCYNATDALVRCVIGRETRKELHEEEIKLVDGNGAARIAKEIIKLGGK